MTLVATILIAAPIVMFVYAYAVYPAVLRIAAAARPKLEMPEASAEWPSISVVIAAHNAEHTIGRTLEHLLAADYPPDRRQIIVASDASTDGTAVVVSRFASGGVELRHLDTRGGKTTAENRVAGDIRGEIVISTDASVVVPPQSIKRLVRHFRDPSVGVASGWAVAPPRATGVVSGGDGDAGYFRYEMWVREMEARFGAIIGAMGGLYAIRRELFRVPLPPYIARDFASALVAWERGYRSLIDPTATCVVGRGVGLRAEYDRKARTMLNGLDTLRHFSHLLDPMQHGWFAFMLLSHKLCRWLVYMLTPAAVVGLALLARDSWPARAALVLGLGLAVGAPLGLRWGPASWHLAAPLAAVSYGLASAAAGVAGWARFFAGRHATTWTPTRREA
jgi:cellulose synthase/poly-beta-1,6-N-acetylglucosamine synthase-like glycosyltransferase